MAKKATKTIDLDFLGGEGAKTDLSGMFAASMAQESDAQQAIMVTLELLLNNPYQPRLDSNEESLRDLAGVIRQQGFQGVLVGRPDPLNRGFYQVTAGHRRREAARRAGIVALPLVVRDLTDEEMITIAITENIQREDLTPLEEGKIYLLMSEEMGFTHEQIAREVGRKRGYVENRIRVARAPRDVQSLVQQKPDSLRAVATLIKVEDESERAEMIEGMLAGKLTVEDLPGYIAAKTSSTSGKSLVVSRQSSVVDERSGVEQHLEVEAMDTVPAAMQATSIHATLEEKGVSSAKEELEPAATTQAAPSPEQEERSKVRIGNAKLAAALRYLSAYREQSEGREAISAQEWASLVQIRALAEELHERFSPGKTDEVLS